MGDDNRNENGTENETAAVTRNDDVSRDLFAKLLIKRIVGFLAQRPSDFAITILPPVPTIPETEATFIAAEAAEEKGDQSSGGGNVPSSSLEYKSLSIEQRSLLGSSIVLMHEQGANGKTVSHLGLEAQNLPLMARVLRKAYRQTKEKSQAASSPSQAEREELFHVTSCLLLIQPDHATAWADRRRCLLSLLNNEIETTNPLAFESPRDSTDEDEKDASFVLWSRELDYLDILFTQHSKA